MLTAEERARARQFNLAAMREHVDKRRENIRIFEEAITGELTGMAKDQEIIEYLEAVARGDQD